MDLQEEYFVRKSVPAHLIRYPERATLFLKSKKPVENNWIQLSVDFHSEPNHPPKYHFTITANPVIYSSQDFGQISFSNSKVITDEFWEWDAYEQNILNWVKKLSSDYDAILSEEAFFTSWEMFLQNTDSWIANFLPARIIDQVADSLHGETATRMKAIEQVERWIQTKYSRIWECWSNIRHGVEKAFYADWLAKVVNNLGKK